MLESYRTEATLMDLTAVGTRRSAVAGSGFAALDVPRCALGIGAGCVAA